MAYVCETCKTSEMDKYWHEVSPRKHKFFKIMLGDFENRLRIPEKFIRCFPGDLSPSCMLKGESGNVWKVRVIKLRRDTLFSDGWANFVRDHNIKTGYFLIFRYVGDSTFKVSIFDHTCCEVEGSYFTKKLNNASSQTSCRSVLHLDNDRSRRTAGVKGKGKEKVDEVIEIDSLESEEENSEDTSHPDIQEEFHSHSSSSRRKRTAQGRQAKTCYLSERRQVTRQEKQATIQMANEHMMSRSKPKREHMFRITMLPTHVTSGFHLTIPKDWATKHLLHTPHDIILQIPGTEESWIVGCRWTAKQCQIRPGWQTFVLENNLEEDDVCVFELIEKKGTSAKKGVPVFNVHIFRVVKELVPLTVSRGVD